MSIVVSREPQALSFSKNPIIYGLQSDALVDNPGTAAVNTIKFAGAIVDGTVIAIRYNGREQRMVARTAVQNAGFEFPAGTTFPNYINDILPYFRDNYYLDRDFIITALADNTMQFVSREPGSAFDFIQQNIPTVQIATPTKGIDRKLKPNFCIYVELWIEKPDESEFEKIFGESIQVTNSGSTEWDLSDLLHPELKPDLHNWTGRQFNKDINSKRRYYIRYAEAWGTDFQIGKITKGPILHVTMGGTPYESGSSITVIDVVRESGNANKDRALRLGPDVRYVFPDEPQFFSFISTRSFYNGLYLRVVAKLAIGGESSVLTVPLTPTLGINDKATANVGYEQLQLNDLGSGNAIESYTVQLFNNDNAVCRPYTYVLKYEYKPYRRYFVYLNSLGSLETMHVWGKSSQEIDLVRKSAVKYLVPDYNLTDGTFTDWDIQYRQKFDAATGYRHAYEVRSFRDFYISLYKFRHFKYKALPVSVLSGTLKEYEDGASLLAQTFEYIYNFEDDTWSEQEDSADKYAPPPGFQGAAGAPIVISVPPIPGSTGGYYDFDQKPTAGSQALVRSGSLLLEFLKKQDKIAKGILGQYVRGDHTLGDFPGDVKGIVDNALPVWKEEEFPDWINDDSSSGRLAAGEPLDNQGGGGGGQQSGFYYTPVTSKAAGWPVDGKQATLIRVVNGTPGSQVGSDIVTTSEGITYIRTVNESSGNGEYKQLGIDARHPTFSNIPPIVVESGKTFTKYLNLENYLTSYHTIDNLTMNVKYNSLKFLGVSVTADGLLLKVDGKIEQEFDADDRILIGIEDQHGNQKVVAIRIESLEETEVPDGRDMCPRGPNHYLDAPIEILSNGQIRIPYDGDGVYESEWKIVKEVTDVTALRGGTQGPENNGPHLLVEFSPLPGGSYYVGIRGYSCKSNWVYRQLNLPTDTTLAWATEFPKFEGGVFKTKINQSLQLLTEIYNATTNAKLYSVMHDYVADITEVSIPKAGGWPDGYYTVNAGTLTAKIKVGNPVDPPRLTFVLKSGWDGATIADLSQGNYDGVLPAGFNVLLESNQLGFSYDYATLILELKILGVWTIVSQQGFSIGSGTSSVLQPWRIFPNAGVDSRFVNYQGASLNRHGEFRITGGFKLGGSSGSNAATKQALFSFNLLEIGGAEVMTGGTTRTAVVLRGVLLNKANVVNDNVWAYPFGGANNLLEFNVDGGTTWYNLSAIWDNFGDIPGTSKIWLLNDEATDLFPPGANRIVRLRMQANHSIVSAPITINVTSSGGDETVPVLLGTYSAEAGGKKYTFQKSPAFSLKFENDGSITDDTPGLVHGNPSKLNGKNVFYMIGYHYLVDNSDGVHSYKPLRNLFLSDELYTIRQFVCDAGKVPNQAAFEAGISGYPESTGINKYNATLSEITITIRTTANPGIKASRVVTRKLDFLNSSPNRAMGGKIFAIEQINRGESPSIYHAKGVHTATTGEHGTFQPNTCRTFKWPYDLHPGDPVFTDSDLYNSLRGHILGFGLTPLSVITDEYPENAQGQDPAIGSRCGIAHRGAMDLFRDQYPGISKRSTNLYGSYGGDNYYGLVDPQFVSKYPKSVVAQYLNEKVFRGMDPSTGIFRDHDVDFYTSGQYLDRNVNVGYYMYNGIYNIPMELLCANERIKIGTKTHNGQDNECDFMVFGTILSQSLVTDNSGNWAGVEDTRTGDVIPFANGEIISTFNTPISAIAGEHYTLGFWATLLGRGIMLWSGGGSYGTDSSKIDNYQPAGQPIFWIKKGGSRENYQSGVNGAPVNSIDGMRDVLYATVVNNTKAGFDAACDLEGYVDTLYYSSYSSSRKSFSASPGAEGFHLNGFGELNIGMLAFKDALDQKCGTSLIGVGTAGNVGIYCNASLSAHEYEDNVILTHGSLSVNLGRVHGGQTKTLKF